MNLDYNNKGYLLHVGLGRLVAGEGSEHPIAMSAVPPIISSEASGLLDVKPTGPKLDSV
jgi:hypothetical protein